MKTIWGTYVLGIKPSLFAIITEWEVHLFHVMVDPVVVCSWLFVVGLDGYIYLHMPKASHTGTK